MNSFFSGISLAATVVILALAINLNATMDRTAKNLAELERGLDAIIAQIEANTDAIKSLDRRVTHLERGRSRSRSRNRDR